MITSIVVSIALSMLIFVVLLFAARRFDWLFERIHRLFQTTFKTTIPMSTAIHRALSNGSFIVKEAGSTKFWFVEGDFAKLDESTLEAELFCAVRERGILIWPHDIEFTTLLKNNIQCPHYCSIDFDAYFCVSKAYAVQLDS